MESAQNRIKAVQTTNEVLKALMELDSPTTQTIAEEVGISTTAVNNHLLTLEELGFVTRKDGRFHPGLAFLEIGGLVRSKMDLYEHGRSEIDRLAKQTGELANLMSEENGQGVHIYLAKGEKAVQFDTHIGRRFNLHSNALGKAILAHLSEDRVQEIISQRGLSVRTTNTISDEDALFDELDAIKERGIAFDDEERLSGLRCVAAPITVDDQILGSISVSGPASRIKGETFRSKLPEKVAEAADLISINIKY